MFIVRVYVLYTVLYSIIEDIFGWVPGQACVSDMCVCVLYTVTEVFHKYSTVHTVLTLAISYQKCNIFLALFSIHLD